MTTLLISLNDVEPLYTIALVLSGQRQQSEIGVFDKVISEYKIKSLSFATPLSAIEQNEEFVNWMDLLN